MAFRDFNPYVYLQNTDVRHAKPAKVAKPSQTLASLVTLAGSNVKIQNREQASIIRQISEAYEERAAICEYDGGMTRDEAEFLAFIEARDMLIQSWFFSEQPAQDYAEYKKGKLAEAGKLIKEIINGDKLL